MPKHKFNKSLDVSAYRRTIGHSENYRNSSVKRTRHDLKLSGDSFGQSEKQPQSQLQYSSPHSSPHSTPLNIHRQSPLFIFLLTIVLFDFAAQAEQASKLNPRDFCTPFDDKLSNNSNELVMRSLISTHSTATHPTALSVIPTTSLLSQREEICPLVASEPDKPSKMSFPTKRISHSTATNPIELLPMKENMLGILSSEPLNSEPMQTVVRLINALDEVESGIEFIKKLNLLPKEVRLGNILFRDDKNTEYTGYTFLLAQTYYKYSHIIKHDRSLAYHRAPFFIEIISYLLSKGANPNIVIQAERVPLLYDAAFFNHKEIIKLLLQHDVNLEISGPTGTALTIALNMQHFSIVKELILHRANLRALDHNGHSALELICHFFNIRNEFSLALQNEIISLYILAMDIARDGKMNLHYLLNEIVTQKDEATIIRILEHQFNNNFGLQTVQSYVLNGSTTYTGDARLLSHAVNSNYSKVVAWLLAHGTNPNCIATWSIEAQKGYHPVLSIAALHGYNEILILLLKHGADIEKLDFRGNTATIVALTNKHFDTARILVEHGASISAEDSNGQLVIQLINLWQDPINIEAKQVSNSEMQDLAKLNDLVKQIGKDNSQLAMKCLTVLGFGLLGGAYLYKQRCKKAKRSYLPAILTSTPHKQENKTSSLKKPESKSVPISNPEKETVTFLIETLQTSHRHLYELNTIFPSDNFSIPNGLDPLLIDITLELKNLSALSKEIVEYGNIPAETISKLKKAKQTYNALQLRKNSILTNAIKEYITAMISHIEKGKSEIQDALDSILSKKIKSNTTDTILEKLSTRLEELNKRLRTIPDPSKSLVFEHLEHCKKIFDHLKSEAASDKQLKLSAKDETLTLEPLRMSKKIGELSFWSSSSPMIAHQASPSASQPLSSSLVQPSRLFAHHSKEEVKKAPPNINLSIHYIKCLDSAYKKVDMKSSSNGKVLKLQEFITHACMALSLQALLEGMSKALPFYGNIENPRHFMMHGHENATKMAANNAHPDQQQNGFQELIKLIDLLSEESLRHCFSIDHIKSQTKILYKMTSIACPPQEILEPKQFLANAAESINKFVEQLSESDAKEMSRDKISKEQPKLSGDKTSIEQLKQVAISFFIIELRERVDKQIEKPHQQQVMADLNTLIFSNAMFHAQHDRHNAIQVLQKIFPELPTVECRGSGGAYLG